MQAHSVNAPFPRHFKEGKTVDAKLHCGRCPLPARKGVIFDSC